jgi:hypothetical protein
MKVFACYAVLASLGLWTVQSTASQGAVRGPALSSAQEPAAVETTRSTLDLERSTREMAVASLQSLVAAGGGGYSTQSMEHVVKDPAAFRFDDGDGDQGGPIECGSARGGVTAGSAAQGCGATVEAAIFNAKFSVETNLWADFPGDCQECPIPGACFSYVSTLDWGWSFGLPFKNGNQWCVVGTYTGAYLFVCEDC